MGALRSRPCEICLKLPATLASVSGQSSNRSERYSSGKIRDYFRTRGIAITIPRKSEERRRGAFDKEICRQRNQVERAFNRLKQSRRVATRYEKHGSNYLVMVTIAAILMWL